MSEPVSLPRTVIDAFHLMWNGFPEPVMLTHKSFEVVAINRACEARGCDLAELPLDELRAFSPLIGDEVLEVLKIEGSLAARNHTGGTAPAAVRQAIARARERLQ